MKCGEYNRCQQLAASAIHGPSDIRTAKRLFNEGKEKEWFDVRESIAISSGIAAHDELRLHIGVDSTSGADTHCTRNLCCALIHNLD